eukprot:CAMPEP_0174900170 /NCGR_PEP_ID=MMETSP0167-20121228/30124_1 /TAXON_ID=38298 /ORGANISM="Rhodella maculata, Strain CCMP736" /LENGTH=55 /DNA_ID=CAMNT_0016141431 /DNA_START=168 /DNA_END=332 /DNA_ORIENTATION=+
MVGAQLITDGPAPSCSLPFLFTKGGLSHPSIKLPSQFNQGIRARDAGEENRDVAR